MLEGVMSRRGFFGLAAVGLLGLTMSGAYAAPFPASEATVERLIREIATLLAEQESGATVELEQLGEVIDQEADLDLLGRLALGRHWRAATVEQQAEYEELFRRMMLRRFAGYLNAYSRNNLDGSVAELIDIDGSREVAGGDVMVDTTISPPNAPPLDVKWRLRQREGKPAVIDLIVGQVSLLITQREEFASVIEQSGIDGLLAKLRDQVGQAPT
jgi:phospholipid transport system substrate-binding protein